MSDWTTQAKCLADIQDGYENAEWDNTWILLPAYNTAYNKWAANDDHGAISHILSYLYWCMDLHSSLMKAHDTEAYKYATPYYLEKYAVVSMDSILDAMWDSDKLRNFHFINWIDAMRASIWNTEIYEKHLEEWYRHFLYPD